MEEIDFDGVVIADAVLMDEAYVVVVVAEVVGSLLAVAGTVVVAAAMLGVVEETKLDGDDGVDENADVFVSA
jgi:hypothetical protein